MGWTSNNYTNMAIDGGLTTLCAMGVRSAYKHGGSKFGKIFLIAGTLAGIRNIVNDIICARREAKESQNTDIKDVTPEDLNKQLEDIKKQLIQINESMQSEFQTVIDSLTTGEPKIIIGNTVQQ